MRGEWLHQKDCIQCRLPSIQTAIYGVWGLNTQGLHVEVCELKTWVYPILIYFLKRILLSLQVVKWSCEGIFGTKVELLWNPKRWEDGSCSGSTWQWTRLGWAVCVRHRFSPLLLTTQAGALDSAGISTGLMCKKLTTLEDLFHSVYKVSSEVHKS